MGSFFLQKFSIFAILIAEVLMKRTIMVIAVVLLSFLLLFSCDPNSGAKDSAGDDQGQETPGGDDNTPPVEMRMYQKVHLN